VDDLPAPLDTDPTGTETPGFIGQPGHQQAVRGKQVRARMGGPVGHLFVSGKGVAHLLNLTGLRQHPFAGQYRRDLFEAQCVAFDSQRRLNGFDAVSPPQDRKHSAVSAHPEFSQRLADLLDAMQDAGGDAVRWGVLISHNASPFVPSSRAVTRFLPVSRFCMRAVLRTRSFLTFALHFQAIFLSYPIASLLFVVLVGQLDQESLFSNLP
jgi:hypothetical protein